MQRVLGIDLGTTNSVCAYIRRGEPEIVLNRQNQESTSSVLAIGKRGELLVGDAAKGRGLLDPANVIYSVKRFMGRRFTSPDVQDVLVRLDLPYQVGEDDNGEVSITLAGRSYTPTELSSLILGRLKADAEDRTGVEFQRAVITVPAYFGERQVAATREAGQLAGFHVLKVLDEPTAAALAYGFLREDPDDDPTLLVFDLGGGTFDISVLIMVGGVLTVLCVEGDNLLGGDDFDRALADRVFAAVLDEQGVDLSADPAAKYPFKTEAEKAKIGLSAELETTFLIPAVAGTSVDHDISQEQFVELIRDRVDRAMALVEKAIAGADLTLPDIDQVLLVGGSTAIPYVQDRLAELFGREKIRKDIHPMKSVALGAAIQGSLEPTIECLSCHADAPIAADDCPACATSLSPAARTACPSCFLYCDVGAAQCARCGSDLVSGAAPTAPTAQALAPVVHACTTCGGRLAWAGLACPRCADPLEGGLRCAYCETINVAGAAECRECGMEIGQTVEITAQDLGIELHDGAMAVILPKNTQFPTMEPVGKEFSTTSTGQPRLEIVVYQGAAAVARDNELCGYLTVALPKDLPRHSPVHVSFGLDRNRTITVSVNVRAGGGERRAEMRRSHLDPETMVTLEAQRREVEKFARRWASELTPAEAAMFDLMTGEMELLLNGGGGRPAADKVMARSTELVERACGVRGKDAFLSAVRGAAGKYISRADNDELERYSYEIDQARERADWQAADLIADRARSYVEGFGPDMLALVDCRAFANQGTLSPALSLRVQAAVRAFDVAFDRGDVAAQKAAMRTIRDLWVEVGQELEGRTDDPIVSGLPQLAE